MNRKKFYGRFFSDENFAKKIKVSFKYAGIKAVYAALLLFYALKDPNVPNRAKATILGALGYFVLPTDLVPDLIPAAGYGDDLTALLSALGVVAVYISPETKRRAKDKCCEWFDNSVKDEISEIDMELY